MQYSSVRLLSVFCPSSVRLSSSAFRLPPSVRSPTRLELSYAVSFFRFTHPVPLVSIILVIDLRYRSQTISTLVCLRKNPQRQPSQSNGKDELTITGAFDPATVLLPPLHVLIPKHTAAKYCFDLRLVLTSDLGTAMSHFRVISWLVGLPNLQLQAMGLFPLRDDCALPATRKVFRPCLPF